MSGPSSFLPRWIVFAFLAVMPVAAMAQPSASRAAPQPPEAAPSTPVLPDLSEPASDPAFDLLRIGADQSDRMTLPVEIGAGGPYPFIVDTGSHRSIVATELAQRLSLPELPPVQIVSMAGYELVDAVRLDAMRFGSQMVNDLPVLSIAHNDLGGAGLIGLDSLKDKRVTLDFKNREMAIVESQSAVMSRGNRDTIVIKARSRLGQLILVDARLDGRKVNVILDTGAEQSVGNMALFNKLKVKKLLIPPQEVEIQSVTGQPVKALFTVVRRLTIDRVTLENVPMVFLDAAPFAELELSDEPAMLLGMRMLRMFDRVAIDFGKRHVDFMLPEGKSSKPSINLFAAR